MIKNMAKSIRWLLLMNPQTFTGISISIQSCCTTVRSQLLPPIPAIQFRSCRRDRLSAVCNNNFSSLVDADYNFCIRAPPPHPMAISVILIPLVNDDDEWGDDDDQDRGKAAKTNEWMNGCPDGWMVSWADRESEKLTYNLHQSQHGNNFLACRADLHKLGWTEWDTGQTGSSAARDQTLAAVCCIGGWEYWRTWIRR